MNTRSSITAAAITSTGNVVIDGVFYFMAVAALILTFLAAGRSFTTTAPHHLERPFEILTPQATPLAHDPLDPSDELRSPDPIIVASESN